MDDANPIDAMSDAEVLALIRQHLVRTFIGELVTEPSPDMPGETVTRHGRHRFVTVFDERLLDR